MQFSSVLGLVLVMEKNVPGEINPEYQANLPESIFLKSNSGEHRTTHVIRSSQFRVILDEKYRERQEHKSKSPQNGAECFIGSLFGQNYQYHDHIPKAFNQSLKGNKGII